MRDNGVGGVWCCFECFGNDCCSGSVGLEAAFDAAEDGALEVEVAVVELLLDVVFGLFWCFAPGPSVDTSIEDPCAQRCLRPESVIMDLPRIDRAVAPAVPTARPGVYSMFVSDGGLYMVKTGSGWLMDDRTNPHRESMVETIRVIERTLDPTNLAAEAEHRPGSLFVAGPSLQNITLERRFDGALDLCFEDGNGKHQVQFDEKRRDEVDTFVDQMRSLSQPAPPDHGVLLYEGTPIETIALPSPCWGATPHLADADGRLFVEHLAPTGKTHADKRVVYRSNEEEQASYVAGELDLQQFCEGLVFDAYQWSPSKPRTR